MRALDDGQNKVLKLRKDGWVELSQEDLKKPSLGLWTADQVLELLHFVIDNGFVKRGGKVFQQVKGFGMGLACAVQMANLGLYPVERDFSLKSQPSEVEDNSRFVDDILTLSGCIPSEEEYGMKYKEVTANGHLVFLGVDLRWIPKKDHGWRFVTGMHFRDGEYPIAIRRYPAGGSMVTDAQRLGVITGQLVRAQRICSIEPEFKAAVQNIAVAAFRRGYKRGELDRIWGKFLVNWWKAQEERKGQLRSWFRKMTAWAKEEVRKETERMQHEEKATWCKFGKRCFKLKDGTCPYLHWEQPLTTNAPTPSDMVLDPPEKPATGEGTIPKEVARVWEALGDGACMFYSVLQANDKQAARGLKERLATYVREHADTDILGDGRTVRELVELVAPGVDEYIARLGSDGYEGDELELSLLARLQKVRLQVYQDAGEVWQLMQTYGAEGPVHRLTYKGKHYNVLLPRESWLREEELIRKEKQQAGKAGHAPEGRDAVKEGTAQPEGMAKRQGAWQSSQEDRRVRQVAALRSAEPQLQADDMLPLTQEMISLLEDLGAQVVCDPTLSTLQLEEESMRVALGTFEEWCALTLGSWEHWQVTSLWCALQHQRPATMANPNEVEPQGEGTPQPSATRQKSRVLESSDGRRDSAKAMTIRDKSAAARRRGSQQKDQQGRHSNQVSALREDAEQLDGSQPPMPQLAEASVSMAGGEPLSVLEQALPATILLEEEHERAALRYLEEAQAQLLGCWLQSTATLWRPGLPTVHKPPDRELPKTVELTGAKMRKDNWQGQQGVRKSSQLTQLRRSSQLDAIMESPSQQTPKVFCKCGSPENPREYWIQCTECRQWYHPRCIGMTKAQCEQERLSGGFVCPDCTI